MRRWLSLVLVVGTILILDQSAKQWVIQTLGVGQTRVLSEQLLPYLQLTRTTNTGIAFGIGTGGSTLFLIMAIAIVIGLIWAYSRIPNNMLWQQIGMAMVIGGAGGNVIDRVRLGHVTDFVHIVIPGLISNVSNFADHAIVLGVTVIIIDNVRREYRARQTQIQEEALIVE